MGTMYNGLVYGVMAGELPVLPQQVIEEYGIESGPAELVEYLVSGNAPAAIQKFARENTLYDGYECTPKYFGLVVAKDKQVWDGVLPIKFACPIDKLGELLLTAASSDIGDLDNRWEELQFLSERYLDFILPNAKLIFVNDWL